MSMYKNQTLTPRKYSMSDNRNPSNKRNGFYIMNQQTCSVCGAKLPRPGMHICEPCTLFLKRKHTEDL